MRAESCDWRKKVTASAAPGAWPERLGSCSIDDHARSEEALAFCRTVELQDGDGAWGARVVEHDSLQFQRVRRAAGRPIQPSCVPL